MAEELENINPQPQIAKKKKISPISKKSKVLPANSHRLTIGTAQQARRKLKTIEAVTNIHSSSNGFDRTAVIDGLWSTAITDVNQKQMTNYLTTSKLCMEKCLPSIVKNNIKAFEGSKENILHSAGALYQDVLISKRKYQELRNNDSQQVFNFMTNIQVPRIVPYNNLIKCIISIYLGKVSNLTDLAVSLDVPKVNGV